MAKKSSSQIIKQGGKAVYSGTATIGNVESIIGLITAIIFFLLLFVGGIVIMVIKYPDSTNDNDDSPSPSPSELPTAPPSKDANKTNFNQSKYIVGSIMIVIGILILTFALLNRYFVKRYKPYAALEGGSAIVSGISRTIG